ncbi:DUF192 domain-containing protein [Spirochaetota bacterium]
MNFKFNPTSILRIKIVKRRPPKIIFASIIVLQIIALQFCRPVNNYTGKCKINIINNQKKTKTLYVETAATVRKRNIGLMYRKNLDINHGMLFIFEDESKLSFWMKNTFIPLSIAYISNEGIINEILHMKPLDTSITYESVKPAKYALEVNKGWFHNNQITKGCKIIFNGCISK